MKLVTPIKPLEEVQSGDRVQIDPVNFWDFEEGERIALLLKPVSEKETGKIKVGTYRSEDGRYGQIHYFVAD